jgi:hypothetical protein
MNKDKPPYHRWPKAYGGWQAGSIILCEGENCQWCDAKWRIVDNETLQDVTGTGHEADA